MSINVIAEVFSPVNQYVFLWNEVTLNQYITRDIYIPTICDTLYDIGKVSVDLLIFPGFKNHVKWIYYKIIMLIVVYYLWSIIKVYSPCSSRLKGYTNYLLFKDKRAFYRYTMEVNTLLFSLIDLCYKNVILLVECWEQVIPCTR